MVSSPPPGRRHPSSATRGGSPTRESRELGIALLLAALSGACAPAAAPQPDAKPAPASNDSPLVPAAAELQPPAAASRPTPLPTLDPRDPFGIANPTVEQVVEKLQDPDWRVRYHACLWLLARPEQAQGAPVFALARSIGDEREEVGRWAAYALSKIGPPAADAVPALLEALKDDRPSLREAAAQALASIGPPPDAEPELLRAVSREDYKTGARKAAVDALARVARSDEAVLGLAALLQDKDVQVARAAEGALSGLGSRARAALPVLIGFLEEPQGRARRAAAVVLGGMGSAGGPAIPSLFGLLEDENKEARDAAAAAIRSIRRGRIAAGYP